tara:strand:+ start:57 stop:530 length:474 start_codon:yes stop_codon:yes gene_type:complete
MIALMDHYMDSLIIFFGSFYILVGTIFLVVPIIYLELGRPKDLIKAFLNLLIGFILIIKNKTIDETFFVIFLFFTLIILLYVLEIFLGRWNQLTDSEKKKLTTFVEFKNNLSKILEAIKLGMKNSAETLNVFNFDSNNKNTNSKKWVRNDKNDNIKV